MCRWLSPLIGGKMPVVVATSEDTIDKIDPDVLALDTRIYVSVLWNCAAAAADGFPPRGADIADRWPAGRSAAGDHLDLSLTHQRRGVAEATAQLAERCSRRTPKPSTTR